MSNQPSTSDTHVNKSQNQKEYAEYVETVALLNEFADAYPITLKPGYCEHDDNLSFDHLSFDQEIPEETFPDRQNTGAGCSITQWHPVVGWPSTNGIHINKSQDQKKYEEYAEYVKTVELLNEFADTYPITPNPGSCGHHDNLFLDQEMSEATFPDKQNADAGYLITQLHPVADWPLTSGIHVNKSQDQEKHKEIIKGS